MPIIPAFRPGSKEEPLVNGKVKILGGPERGPGESREGDFFEKAGEHSRQNQQVDEIYGHQREKVSGFEKIGLSGL